jgi:uncharacterized membrane protein YkoI
MKIKMIICSALATTLLTGCISINTGGEGHGGKCEMGEHQGKKGEKGERGEAKNKEDSQAKLMAEAKISKETAGQTALAKVPNGTIKDSELEKENGKLQWSVEVAAPGSKDITEVNVDAVNGHVIFTGKETPEKESKEKDNDGDKD